MVRFFARFLTSRFSGYLALVLALIITPITGKIIWEYKELQRKAAYCEGQLAAQLNVQSLQKRVTDSIDKARDEVISDVEAIKAEPDGCAAERAPDSVLDYHDGVLHKDG